MNEYDVAAKRAYKRPREPESLASYVFNFFLALVTAILACIIGMYLGDWCAEKNAAAVHDTERR